MVDGIKLSIEPLVPGHPPPVFDDALGQELSKDCLLFVNLPANAELQSFCQFAIKAAGDIPVISIGFGPEENTALVKYFENPGGSSWISIY